MTINQKKTSTEESQTQQSVHHDTLSSHCRAIGYDDGTTVGAYMKQYVFMQFSVTILKLD